MSLSFRDVVDIERVWAVKFGLTCANVTCSVSGMDACNDAVSFKSPSASINVSVMINTQLHIPVILAHATSNSWKKSPTNPVCSWYADT